LRTLNIFVDAYSQGKVDEAIEMLNRSRDIARLRSRRNLVVDIRRELLKHFTALIFGL